MSKNCDNETPKNFLVDRLNELDQEIAQFESSLLDPVETTRQSLLRRFLDKIRDRLIVKSIEKTESEGFGGKAKELITCRICDHSVDIATLEKHTEWCSKYQNCLLKREKCAVYLDIVYREISESDRKVLDEVVKKALEINEEDGKMASVKLAKLLYRIAKLDEHDQANSLIIKRLRYLVEQKSLLADRFAELYPQAPRHHYDSDSSCTDSSLASTPSIPADFKCCTNINIIDQPGTPISKISNLLSTLLKPRSASKSPQFGSSPSRSSTLRTHVSGTIPDISDFEIIKPISKGAFGYDCCLHKNRFIWW